MAYFVVARGTKKLHVIKTWSGTMAEAVVAVVTAGKTVGTVAVAVVGDVAFVVVAAVSATVTPTVGRPFVMTPLAVRAAFRAAGLVEGRGEAEAAGISILWASLKL